MHLEKTVFAIEAQEKLMAEIHEKWENYIRTEKKRI